MRFVQWMKREMVDKVPAFSKRGALREHDELRVQFVQHQRALTTKWEKRERALQKRLAGMVERIRGWQGSVQEATRLEAEQRHIEQLLERLEISDADTVELLREWRDWMRALRRGLGYDAARVELVGSELRLRGVIAQDEIAEARKDSRDGDKDRDAFLEWDEQIGARLPETSAFWQGRVEELQSEGAHEVVLHGFVKHMKQAHGQAHAWRRMQG